MSIGVSSENSLLTQHLKFRQFNEAREKKNWENNLAENSWATQ